MRQRWGTTEFEQPRTQLILRHRAREECLSAGPQGLQPQTDVLGVANANQKRPATHQPVDMT